MAKENPKRLKYTENHEWVRVKGNIATVGITDYAQELLTDVVYVELPEIDKQVQQAESLCVVESVKSVSDVYAPVSGEVIEVNEELEDHPELVNQDAFGKGWMAKMKMKDENELNNLMSAEEYDKFIE